MAEDCLGEAEVCLGEVSEKQKSSNDRDLSQGLANVGYGTTFTMQGWESVRKGGDSEIWLADEAIN